MTTIVAGVGMIPFAKPGASAPYDAMGEEAVKLALADAGLGYDAIEDSPQQFAADMAADIGKFSAVVKRAGIKGQP